MALAVGATDIAAPGTAHAQRFATAARFCTGSQASSVALGDHNDGDLMGWTRGVTLGDGDGDLDIATANNCESSAIYYNSRR